MEEYARNGLQQKTVPKVINFVFTIFIFFTFVVSHLLGLEMCLYLVPGSKAQSVSPLVKVSLEKPASKKLSMAKTNQITASRFFFSERFMFLYLLTMFIFLPGCLVGK